MIRILAEDSFVEHGEALRRPPASNYTKRACLNSMYVWNALNAPDADKTDPPSNTPFVFVLLFREFAVARTVGKKLFCDPLRAIAVCVGERVKIQFQIGSH